MFLVIASDKNFTNAIGEKTEFGLSMSGQSNKMFKFIPDIVNITIVEAIKDTEPNFDIILKEPATFTQQKFTINSTM